MSANANDEPSADTPTNSAAGGSTTSQSGGVNVSSGHVRAGGDVVGRDKVIRDIYNVGEGATVIFGERAAPAAAESDEPAPGEPPFKGLLYFDVADAPLFFGREAVTAKLVAHVREQRLLAVVGASGSGKSSVVRAGLVAAMHPDKPQHFVMPDGSPRWQLHLIKPTEHPLKELAASLTRASESVTAQATLIDDLAHDARSLDLAASRALKQDGGERLLLVVDQFEEVFTACKEPIERKAFVDNLLHAVADDTAGPVRVVLTVRADFYEQCAVFPDFFRVLPQHQYNLNAMQPDELRRAIEQPAREGNWQFEAGLVDLLLTDVGHEPGALPLLSHALLETWKRRRGRQLTLQGYHEAGGVRGAIAQSATAVYLQLRDEQQRIARGIFVSLTEMRDDAPDTRRRVARRSLSPHRADQPSVDAVLTMLVEARLVIAESDTVEVAHEALIREWDLLRTWLDDRRADERVKRRLNERAQEWEQSDQNESFLYHGYQLDGAMQWRAQHEDTLDDSARAFLDASKAAHEREQQQNEERQARESEIEKRRAVSDALADERDRQFRFLKQAGGGALGVGLGFALGFALLTYFKSAALLPNLLIGVVALAFLTMFPIGAAIGFGMGLCLWRWQAQPKRKWLAMLLVCAPLSAIAFALYVAVAAPPLNAGHLIVGALLGAGLGVSAALARARTQRLLFIPMGTALAAILSALFSDLWSNNFALALICGLSIGALGGLGFYVFASADEASRREVADARA